MSTRQPKLLQAYAGMNLDSPYWGIDKGELSYALNAVLQSLEGDRFAYTNELSNQLCVQFPAGFVVIGLRNIVEQNRVIVLLASEGPTKKSIVGEIIYNDANCIELQKTEKDCGCEYGNINTSSVILPSIGCCQFNIIAETFSPDCLNFNIDYPVTLSYKVDFCGTNIYFRDSLNGLRWLNLDHPYGDDGCGNYYATAADNNNFCQFLNIFPSVDTPCLLAESIDIGGNLQAGTYQIAIAPCDAQGNELADYSDLSNPVSIFERKITVDTNYYTNKSIRFLIQHPNSPYEYFSVAVAKTITNQTGPGTTTYYKAGVYKIPSTLESVVIITGNDLSPEALSPAIVLKRTPYYSNAGSVENSNDLIMWGDLEGQLEYNLQPLANQIKLYWQTVKVKANKLADYYNGVASANYRTYMRDEAYPFGFRVKLKNGYKTCTYIIPGNPPTNLDMSTVTASNPDVIQDDDCTIPEDKKYWQVYNSASKIGFTPEYFDYVSKGITDCDVMPYEYGEFGYYESILTYPCNEDIWGELAGKPIRFHRFPDSAVTHIHDKSSSLANAKTDKVFDYESHIFPIGVRIDEQILINLWFNFPIKNPKTGEMVHLSDIAESFEIVRGNRVGNKSVIAKGLLYDVGVFKDGDEFGSGSGKTILYPNYPYNDLHRDPFLANDRKIYSEPDFPNTEEDNIRLDGFNWDDNAQESLRYTFHSPDTHFQSPQIGNILKLETLETGVCKGHFVPVAEHPRYKFLTKFDTSIGAILGAASAAKMKDEFSTTITGGTISGVETDPAVFLQNANGTLELLEKLIPLRNFAYQYNSIGNYNNYTPITSDPAKQHKQRKIEIGRYLSPNVQHVDDIAPVNNYWRESSVYIKVNKRFQTYQHYLPGVNEISRYTLSSYDSKGWCKEPEFIRNGNLASFYASIKRTVPDQYGTVDQISWVNTGYCGKIVANVLGGWKFTSGSLLFGGDTFINRFTLKRKMPFFTQNMVKRPDEIDFDYQLVPNVAFPMYYIGTSPDPKALTDMKNLVGLAAVLAGTIGASLAAATPAAVGTNTYAKLMIFTGLTKFWKDMASAFIPMNNLDCDITPAEVFDIQIGKDGVDISESFGDGNWTLFFQSGKFYLAAYGLPTFFVESDINVDYRHGLNLEERNFHNDLTIPDDWLQEARVPIAFDNFYAYNSSYSKQNIENYICTYNPKFPDQYCAGRFDSRVIYSDEANNESLIDNWKIYRPNNYFDFPKTHGRLIEINSLENDKVLVRFEKTAALYNARIVVDSQYPIQTELGTGGMFAQKPIEFSRSTLGFGGSQHKAFVYSKYGAFWTDAERGYVYHIAPGQGLDEISNHKTFAWFKRNLPFQIKKHFNVNIDNAFKDIGIALTWDERFERLILTKLDYAPVEKHKARLSYREGKFYYDGDIEVSLSDTKYFENRSFTVSYSPVAKLWTSFHSYLPNYYVSHLHHFQSGNRSGVWNHGLSNLTYQTFYNKLYPYILEYTIPSLPLVNVLDSISYVQDILEFTSETDYYSLNTNNTTNLDKSFNKAIVYNKEQTTGLLNLKESVVGDLKMKMSYPRITPNGIDVLYSKIENTFTFNDLWDSTLNFNGHQPIFTTEWDQLQAQYPIDKVLNSKNLGYTRTSYKKNMLRSQECRVRLIQDQHSRYKYVNHFALVNQTISIK